MIDRYHRRCPRTTIRILSHRYPRLSPNFPLELWLDYIEINGILYFIGKLKTERQNVPCMGLVLTVLYHRFRDATESVRHRFASESGETGVAGRGR
jgi:hypothetical protein